MCNVVDDIEATNPALMQEINGMRFFFAKQCNQDVCTSDFFFTGRLNVKNGALYHALKAHSRLGLDISVAW